MSLLASVCFGTCVLQVSFERSLSFVFKVSVGFTPVELTEWSDVQYSIIIFKITKKIVIFLLAKLGTEVAIAQSSHCIICFQVFRLFEGN